MSKTAIDLSYRPRFYFWATDHCMRLSSDIKGANRKRLFEKSVIVGAELPTDLLKPGLSEDCAKHGGGFTPRTSAESSCRTGTREKWRSHGS